VPAANLDLRLELISGPDGDGLRKNTALPGLLGCQAVQGAVWAVFIEPGSEVVSRRWTPLRVRPVSTNRH